MTAEYATPSNAVNQVVIYDKIIQSAEDASFSLKNEYNKYNLFDFSGELRGADLTLRLSWDVMPLFGPLDLQHGGEFEFVLPAKYGSGLSV